MLRKRISSTGHDLRRPSDEELKAMAADLSPEEARVILSHGTEAPGCGVFLDNKTEGLYACRLCGLALFESSAKFDSGSGWPSFFQPVDQDHVARIEDRSHGMTRVEIVCARCGGHLGHVFPDGPPPTGERHCLNSASLEFFEAGAELPERTRKPELETAYFAAGCFWGVEDRFQREPGVIDATSGYMGGETENPGYREVCSGKTGHAEAVRVTFDPGVVTYEALLGLFFGLHDPTQKDRQGPDIGTQYRSAIFPADDAQREAAEQAVRTLREQGLDVATRVEEADVFHEAEPAHQDYNERHGRVCALG